jgi:ectoine hydroxylase-related dioxygenase (phytanoyl-CoA dioxygenase family)
MTMTAPPTPRLQITPDQVRQYREEGYFMLPSVLSPEQLELLRSQADFAIKRADAEMDAAGVDVMHLNRRGKRYFTSHVFKQQPILRRFLFSDLMADLTRAVLGPDVWLFWEQYVIKCADKETKFSWHQDSGYVHWKNKPYLTCWITLDDVTLENGTVYLLPYSRSGIRSWVKHIEDPATQDLVGYFGSDRGIPVILPAGSIACFSSYVFHSSGANLTPNMRRIYLAQYAAELVMKEDGSTLWGLDEPFLKCGKRVNR